MVQFKAGVSSTRGEEHATVRGAGGMKGRGGAFAGRVLAAAVVLGLCAAAAGAARAERVVLLAAASTAAAVEEAIARFDAGPGNRVVASYAGTPALARQIESGAPADLFLAANAAWMDYLEARGFVAPGSRRALLGNRLVLVAAQEGEAPPAPLPPLDAAALPAEGRLAMGDPAHVPVGIYARQALEALGLWPALRGRIAPAADARANGAGKPAAQEPMRTMFDTASPPPRPEAAAEDEADLLEIPAFLRRQAN